MNETATTDTTTVEGIRAEIEALQEQLTAKKSELRALRGSTAKAKAEPKTCGCGCGELTRGGDFLPGHDARFRGRLLTAVDAGGPEGEAAITALLARPTLLHGATEAELRERLGSEQRQREAKVAREAERRQAKTAAKSKPRAKKGGRVDRTEQQQGTRSPSVAKNGAAIRNAAQQHTDHGAPRSEGIDAAL